MTSPGDFSVTFLWLYKIHNLWHHQSILLETSCCQRTRWQKHKILNLQKKIVELWSPGHQKTKFGILLKDCEIMVTRWPKQKILNFAKRLWNYSHQVTKTQNLEFYKKILKIWSPGDQKTKFGILPNKTQYFRLRLVWLIFWCSECSLIALWVLFDCSLSALWVLTDCWLIPDWVREDLSQNDEDWLL